MVDKNLILLVNFSKLVAVNEYLRDRGDEQICYILDGVVRGFQIVLFDSKTKINYGNARSCNHSS